MRITSTGKIKSSIVIYFLSAVLFLGIVSCTKPPSAEEFAKKSQAFFERSVREYNSAIAKGGDLNKLYYELGQLYYEHGKYTEAVTALKNTNNKEAKKILAISFYHLGIFTDALEVFNQQECPDDECLYYQGLTSEKLNLFDGALKTYAKVKSDPEFKRLAIEHSQAIEKGVSLNIKDLNPEISKIISTAPKEEDYPEA